MTSAEQALREIKLLLQAQRRAQKRLEPVISRSCLDSGLLLLWHTQGDMELAQWFLDKLYQDSIWSAQRCSKGRRVASLSHVHEKKPGAETCCPPSWVQEWQDAWAKWNMDNDISVLMADSKRLNALKRAEAFVRGERLLHWLSRQNEKALAPSGPATAAARARAFRRAGPRTDAVRTWSGRTQRRREAEWVCRGARPCGVVRGRFTVGSGLALEEAREKAVLSGKRDAQRAKPVRRSGNGGPCRPFFFGATTHFSGTRFAPGKRAPFWDLCVAW